MDIPREERSPDDAVLRQLKKLREGAGLSRDRLAASGVVMSALGTSDPDEAYGRLLGVLAQLDGQHAGVLRVDFALDLGKYLQRKPLEREKRWLGDRRAGYSQIIGRDPKTLSRWSEQAIAELRTRLLNDTYTGALYLVAAVRGGRLLGVSLIQEEAAEADCKPVGDPKAQGDITSRSSLDYSNPTSELSLPCLLYALPRDWRPTSLTLAVSFLDEPFPSTVWAFHAPNFIEASYAATRYALGVEHGTATCRVIRPRRDRIYGIWWS